MSNPFKRQGRTPIERALVKYEVAAGAFEAMETLIKTLEARTSEALGRVVTIDRRMVAHPLSQEGLIYFLEERQPAMEAYKAVLAERNAAYLERMPLFRAMSRAERALERARDAERLQARRVA